MIGVTRLTHYKVSYGQVDNIGMSCSSQPPELSVGDNEEKVPYHGNNTKQGHGGDTESPGKKQGVR